MLEENKNLDNNSVDKKTIADIRRQRSQKQELAKEVEAKKEVETKESQKKEASKKPKAKKTQKRETPKLSDDYQELLSNSLQKLRDQIKTKKNEEKLSKQTKKESESTIDYNISDNVIEELEETITELKEKNSSLEESLESLNDKYSNLSDKVSSLEEENEDLSSKLNSTLNENEELEKALSEKDSKFTELENSNNDLLNKLNNVVSEKENLEKELNDKTSKVNALENSNNSLDSEVKKLQEESKKLSDDLSNLNSEKANLENELDNLKKSYNELESKVSLEEKRNDTLSEKIVLREEKIKDLESKLEGNTLINKEELEKLQNDLAQEIEKNNDSENLIKTLQLENENIQKSLEEVTKSYDECKDELSQNVTELEKANEEVNKLSVERDEACDKLSEVSEKISELESKCQTLTDKNESLDATLEETTASLSQLDATYNEVLEKYNALESSHSELSNEHSSLKTEYDKLLDRCNQLVDENDAFRLDKELITRDSYENALRENEDLKQQVTELNEELDMMTEHVNELSNNLNQTEESLESAHQDISEYKEKIISFDQERSNYNQTITDLNDEIVDKNNEISNLYLQVSDIDFKLQEALDKLEASPSKESYDDLLLKCDELQRFNDDLTKEIQSLAEQLDEAKLNSGNSFVQESVFDYERYNEIEQKYQAQLVENKELVNQINSLKYENEILNNKNNSDYSTLDQLQRKYNILKDDYTKLQNDSLELQEKCNYLEIELKNASLNDASSEDIKFLKEQISENHKQYRILLNESNEKLSKAQKENNSLKQQIEDTKKQYSYNIESVEDLRHKLLEKTNEISEYKYQANLLNQEVSRLTSALRGREDELTSIKNRYEDLQDRYNRDLYQMKSQSQYDDNYRRLEKNMEYLLDSISKMNNNKQDNSNINYIEHMNEIRNLREEINNRFNQERQEKYHDELRNLREQFNNLNNRLSQTDSYESLKNQAITEAQIESSEVSEYHHKPEEFNAELYNDEIISSLGYTKDEITDPRFVSEYSKIERLIQAHMNDIQEDFKRYENALKQNEEAKQRRNQLIEQVRNRINFLAKQYQKSTDNLDAKEAYAKERVIGAEKIRFHNEKIAELDKTILEGEAKHNRYRQTKINQIEELKNKQKELIETFSKILSQKGIKPQSSEEKAEETVSKDSASKEVRSEVNFDPEIKMEFDNKYNAFKKYKQEIEKVNLFIQNLIDNEEVVREYIQYEKNSIGLNEKLQSLTENNSHLKSLLASIGNDLNRQEEIESIKADLENNNVRVDDILSKISFNNKKQEELKANSHVSHYINARQGISKIASRMDILKNDLTILRQKIGA